MDEQLIERLRRMYFAIGETVEVDMSKLPGMVVSGPDVFAVIQDFRGDKSPEQMANTLHSAIALVGGLEYHLRKWAHHAGHDPETVGQVFRSSDSLKIIHDLWNAEKHGYPMPHGKDRSGRAPQIREIRRVMKLTTQSHAGSVVGMTLARDGRPLIHGDGSASAVITGEIVDRDGTSIGEIDDVLSRAVKECEILMGHFGANLSQS